MSASESGRRKLLRSEAGSVTLESSLIMPTILIIVVSVLFVSLYYYEHVILHYKASSTAERLAYVWDNSYKDAETGFVPPNRHDGLYWRTGSRDLSGLFSFGAENAVTISLPAYMSGAEAREDAGESLQRAKLARAAELLPQSANGRLGYRHRLIDREISVTLGKAGVLPFLSALWMENHMEAQAISVATDPVDRIRTVDLVRTYFVRLKDYASKPKAAETIPAPPRPIEKLAFARAEEAAAYLRTLVGGVKASVNTPSQKNRQLDALDADGLFHEVKLGYTSKSKDVEAQIAKDLELLRSGTVVKGAVWHFFRKAKDGKLGPSKPLRQELERHGIIVVIHQ